MSLLRGRFTALVPPASHAEAETMHEASVPETSERTRTNRGPSLDLKRTPDERDVRALTTPTSPTSRTAKTTAAAAETTATIERAERARKNVRMLSEGREVPLFAARGACTVLRIRPSGPSGPSGLGPVRKLPPWARQLVLANIVSAVSHCHALAIDVAVHAGLTLVSNAGDARISLDAAPDVRYSAPETLFGPVVPSGLASETRGGTLTWSLACLLAKLITGKPLVRDGSRNAQSARILSLAGALRVRDARLAALFDALDATQWKNRPPKRRAVLPPHATARERDVIRASLRWTNRPPLDAFRLTRPAHSPSLDSTAEEEE